MYGTLIGSVTVGAGGVSSITFSSIPQNYTDLTVVLSGRGTFAQNSGYAAFAQFNGSTSGYSWRELDGYNSTGTYAVGSYNYSAQTCVPIGTITSANQTASTFGNSVAYIPNYAGSANKIVFADGVDENNAAYMSLFISGGMWANTAAITSITLNTNGAGNFVQYTTAYLYGTTKGSGGASVA